MPQKATIYIVDDDPGVAEAIVHLVKPTGAQVGVFSTADSFLRSYCPAGPACLVLDVRMPGMGGLELRTRLAHAGDTIPVIIVTGHADVKMAVDAVKGGAFGFLEKPFRPQELFEEIQNALRSDEDVWRRREEENRIESRLALLKPGERDVLNLVVDGKTNEEIAQQLDMSVRGVEARRAKAMKKLGVESRAQLLELYGARGGSCSAGAQAASRERL